MGKNTFSVFLFALFLFVTPKGFAQYCQPSFGNGCSWGDVIDDFVIKDKAGGEIFRHLGTGCSGAGYVDYTSDASLEINLSGDSEYDFHVTSVGNNQYISVWIDLDGTGDFAGADDLLFQSTSGSEDGFGTPILGSMTIPNIQGVVATRMRVKTAYGSAGSADSCGYMLDGEVHDYTVVITGENPNCLSPSNLILGSTTSTTADFSWGDVVNGVNNYSWHMMNEGEHPDEDTPMDSGSVSFGEESVTVSGLSESIYYDFYIQSNCGADGESMWRNLSFYIPAQGVNCENSLDIGSLPFSHADNTGEYLNIYEGTPGSSCGVEENYLNGYDVVYSYEAVENDLISIILSDLSDYYAGVFVYDSCEVIGDECLASATAGPSSDDFGVIDFPVEKGEVYYIVVSSWLTESFDYKLDVKPFTCSELEKPAGDVVQDFTAGDSMADLIAVATRENATLNWYEDVSLTNKIADLSSVDLVDGATYYVTQTVADCMGPALEIKVEEIDCASLDIIDFTDASVTCRGSMTLMAKGSGVGNETLWYTEEVGGNPIYRGFEYETPELTETTSFWVEEVYGKGMETIEGLGRKTPEYPFGYQSGGFGLEFQAARSFTLVDVEITSVGNGGEMVIELRDDLDNILAETTVMVPSGKGSNPSVLTVPLNFFIPSAGKYQLVSPTGSMDLLYDPSNNEFPYSLGEYGEINGGVLNTLVYSTYFVFYNWTISGGDVICESSRQEVVASVDQSGDVELTHADLPYVDTNNTALFDNNFTGSVGDGCVGNLDGHEVMYHYASNPDEDEILQIELTDVDNPSASIFLYDNCSLIGLECIKGAVFEDGVAKVEDYYLEAGEDLIILVSASSSTVNYTLSIEGNDCDNVILPTGDPVPYFADGATVDNLFVKGSIFNDGFKWYKDAALSDEIVDLTSVDLIDGESYYVTQTILDCESAGFEVAPIEFECDSMDVDPAMDTYYVCSPGDQITLEVNLTGIGSEVYWYDAAVDGEMIGRGPTLKTFVEENTSFWATEVFTQESDSASEDSLPDYCLPDFQAGCAFGHSIEDFILGDNSGATLIDHRGTGCSDSGYGDFTDDISLTASLTAGEKYNFTVTHNARIEVVRVWIDYDGDGEFNDDEELVFEYYVAPTEILPVDGEFILPFGIVSKNTVMRVVSTYTSEDSGACNQTSLWGEAHDYKVTLVGESVVCQSPRQEIPVVVNDSIPEEPIVTSVQTICGDSLFSDLVVLGEDIKWYNSSGPLINPNSEVEEGEAYYVTQTVKGCESPMKEVIMNFSEMSDGPVAASNQAFESGDDLATLEVYGDNLTWYVDKWRTKELEASTLLVDQTTYYVTQVQEEKCESEPMVITVHETLDIEDVLFEHFEFYPNPVQQILYINNAQTIEQVEIYDLSGKKVFDQKYQDGNVELDVSNLSTGTYLMKAKVNKSEKVFRVIKK